MSDTIDLLEAIGSDGTLRNASTEHLSRVLANANASDALMGAVASGDKSKLFDELGDKPMYMPQISQSPGHEEDEPADDDKSSPDPEQNPSQN